MMMFTGEQLPDKLLDDKNLTKEEDKDNSNDELTDESDDSSSGSVSNSDMDWLLVMTFITLQSNNV